MQATSTDSVVRARAPHKNRHGLSRSRIYIIWRGMMQRCHNPDDATFRLYGARGISVCQRWHDFDVFRSDMGECPSTAHQIDRINNDGNYEPGNVRWATPVEQANNRRTNRLLTFNGETLTKMQWARRLGISFPSLRDRLAIHPVEVALSAERLTKRTHITRQRAIDRDKKSSRFLGVTKHSKRGWNVRMTIDGKRRHIGYFKDEIGAARCYDEAARKFFGEGARLNFPEAALVA